jgi:hypothetical protein
VTRARRPLAALAVVALLVAGCASGSADTPNTATGSGGATTTATTREKAMKFSECMRDNGVTQFPDPNASGELTIDAVANGTSLDTSSAAFKTAIGACRDLQPPGFTGHKRSAQQQTYALKFAQCMRDNGIKDFPDPTPDGALIDTNRIPSAAGRGARSIRGFDAAAHKCTGIYSGKLGLNRR